MYFSKYSSNVLSLIFMTWNIVRICNKESRFNELFKLYMMIELKFCHWIVIDTKLKTKFLTLTIFKLSHSFSKKINCRENWGRN